MANEELGNRGGFKRGTREWNSWINLGKHLFPEDSLFVLEQFQYAFERNHAKDASFYLFAALQEFSGDTNVRNFTEPFAEALWHYKYNVRQRHLVTRFNKIFNHLTLSEKRQFLLLTASKTEDIVRFCRLMALYLSLEPCLTIEIHGLKLIKALSMAEEIYTDDPINWFRKLLVYDVVPLVFLRCSEPISVSADLAIPILFKSMEFYITYLTSEEKIISGAITGETIEPNKIWENLFLIYEKFASMLGWELASIFSSPWSLKSASREIENYIENNKIVMRKQEMPVAVVYTLSLLFCYCLCDFSERVNQGNMTLIEIPKELYYDKKSVKQASNNRPSTCTSIHPHSKKLQQKNLISAFTKEVPVDAFLCAVKCWALINKTSLLKKGCSVLMNNFHLEVWMNTFLKELYVYNGMYEQHLISNENEDFLKIQLALISNAYCKKDYTAMMNEIKKIVDYLNGSPEVTPVKIDWTSDIIEISPLPKDLKRHLHFIRLDRDAILNYLTRMMSSSLQIRLLKITDKIEHFIKLLKKYSLNHTHKY